MGRPDGSTTLPTKAVLLATWACTPEATRTSPASVTSIRQRVDRHLLFFIDPRCVVTLRYWCQSHVARSQKSHFLPTKGKNADSRMNGAAAKLDLDHD